MAYIRDRDHLGRHYVSKVRRRRVRIVLGLQNYHHKGCLQASIFWVHILVHVWDKYITS